MERGAERRDESLEQGQSCDCVIAVEPVEGGWCVTCGGCGESLMFLSGGRAEFQARVLARCLAGLCKDARVEIHDRQNVLAGAVRYVSERIDLAAEGRPR